eukprot:4320484-Amphidinium_carterae.1
MWRYDEQKDGKGSPHFLSRLAAKGQLPGSSWLKRHVSARSVAPGCPHIIPNNWPESGKNCGWGWVVLSGRTDL